VPLNTVEGDEPNVHESTPTTDRPEQGPFFEHGGPGVLRRVDVLMPEVGTSSLTTQLALQ
jgi:hypothetical protein